MVVLVACGVEDQWVHAEAKLYRNAKVYYHVPEYAGGGTVVEVTVVRVPWLAGQGCHLGAHDAQGCEVDRVMHVDALMIRIPVRRNAATRQVRGSVKVGCTHGGCPVRSCMVCARFAQGIPRWLTVGVCDRQVLEPCGQGYAHACSCKALTRAEVQVTEITPSTHYGD